MTQADRQQGEAGGPERPNRVQTAGLFESLCGRLCELALFAMVAVVGVDIFTRSLFGFSFQIADEVASYMLVAMAFLSLSVCQANDSFHRVEFLQAMLSSRARAVSRVVFDLLTLALAAVLVWQFGRFEIASWRSGSMAPTLLRTPLWLPQLVMLLGTVAFAAALLRSLSADIRALRNPPAERES